jgi:hypothetical protein
MSFVSDSNGSNNMYFWGYVTRANNQRVIYVMGIAAFTSSGYAVMDDFGNLVQV